MKKLNLKSITAIVAVAVASIGFLLMSFEKAPVETGAQILDPVTLYFSGNAHDADEVADLSNWAEDNPALSCSGSAKACSMTVDENDVQGPDGSRTLNPSQIELSAQGNDTNGYRAIKSGGSSPTNPLFTYQN